jgi:two-component system LytT family sensor kinase
MKMRCESCGAPLATDGEAYICSYECTFCPACAVQGQSPCTHCGGELIRRPRRKTSLPPAAKHEPPTLGRERAWVIWVVSFGLWIFIAFASALSMYEFQRSLGRSTTFRAELTLPLIQSLIFAFLTPFVFNFAIRHPVQRENWVSRSWLHLAASMAFAATHVLIRGSVYPVWDPDVRGYAWALRDPQSHALRIKWALFERLFLYNAVDDIYSVYLPIAVIAFAIGYYQRFRERELRATQLEGQLAKAHLQALKSRLQPHFLFNTMHSISALMHTDVAAADKMMTLLCDLLRMSLEKTGVQVTTLNCELEFLDSYLAIEKVRFGDRLRVVTDVSSDTLGAHVPHLILQPLVENAVRHGVAKRSTDGEVCIAVSHDDHHLYLRVKDDGPGLNEHPPKRGLGLEATRERLQTLYGDNQSIEIRNTSEGGVEVCVRIPFSS